MKFILLCGVVYVATLAADFAWAKWMMYTAAKRPHLAGVWSAAIIACGAVNVVSYTENHWLIIPMLFGAYCGTYLAVVRDLTSTSELDREQACTPVTAMAPPRPYCDHRNCTVSEQDGELLRWSCGRIEG